MGGNVTTYIVVHLWHRRGHIHRYRDQTLRPSTTRDACFYHQRRLLLSLYSLHIRTSLRGVRKLHVADGAILHRLGKGGTISDNCACAGHCWIALSVDDVDTVLASLDAIRRHQIRKTRHRLGVLEDYL